MIPSWTAAFSADNPAVTLWRLLNEDRKSLEMLAARIGAKPELDEDSFFRVAHALERPKETA